MCLNDGQPVDPSLCDESSMPASDGDCNVEECIEASGEEMPSDSSDGGLLKIEENAMKTSILI